MLLHYSDRVYYGLAVAWRSDARMFLVRQGQSVARLTEFCRDRFGIGDASLELAIWGSRVLAPGENVPPEGTPLVLRRKS